MKAFIVLALVACAYARSLDVDTLRLLNREKSLLNRDSDLLLKERMFGNRMNTFGLDYPKTFDYPTMYPDMGFDVNTWGNRRVAIYTIEELMAHPLFREYMQLPMFRHFWEQYPVVFRRYVESPLFQQFWTVPQFQQYFRNPILFYKYIVPQVQMVARSQYNPFTTTTRGIYNYPTTMDMDIQGEYTRPIVNVGDFLNRMMLGHGIMDRTSTMYPWSIYNQDRINNIYGTPIFGMNRGYQTKYLLDKIYRTLFKPTVGDATEVETDVKVAPLHKEVVVEPITGERKVVLEPTKIVDVKVDSKIIPTGVETDDQLVKKDLLLKRLLITRHITPEMYTILKTLPYYHVKEILRRIVPDSVLDIDTMDFPHHMDVSDLVRDVDFSDVTYRHKINQIINQLYNNEIVGDRYTPVARDLLKVLGHRGYNTYPLNTLDDILRV